MPFLALGAEHGAKDRPLATRRAVGCAVRVGVLLGRGCFAPEKCPEAGLSTCHLQDSRTCRMQLARLDYTGSFDLDSHSGCCYDLKSFQAKRIGHPVMRSSAAFSEKWILAADHSPVALTIND